MRFYQKGENFVVVLQKGEEIFESLKKFLDDSGLHSAWITGLGGAMEVELGFYNLDEKKYHWKTFSETLEVTGLTGNILQGGSDEPLFHIHGTFANSSYDVIGGHVNKLVTGGTMELHLTPIGEDLSRVLDEETGLKLLR